MNYPYLILWADQKYNIYPQCINALLTKVFILCATITREASVRLLLKEWLDGAFKSARALPHALPHKLWRIRILTSYLLLI